MHYLYSSYRTHTTNIIYDILFIDSPVHTHTSVGNNVSQKPSTDEKNGLPDDDLNVQPLPSKVQDIISIGSRYSIIN